MTTTPAPLPSRRHGPALPALRVTRLRVLVLIAAILAVLAATGTLQHAAQAAVDRYCGHAKNCTGSFWNEGYSP